MPVGSDHHFEHGKALKTREAAMKTRETAVKTRETAEKRPMRCCHTVRRRLRHRQRGLPLRARRLPRHGRRSGRVARRGERPDCPAGRGGRHLQRIANSPAFRFAEPSCRVKACANAEQAGSPPKHDQTHAQPPHNTYTTQNSSYGSGSGNAQCPHSSTPHNPYTHTQHGSNGMPAPVARGPDTCWWSGAPRFCSRR